MTQVICRESSLVAALISHVIPCEVQEIEKHLHKVKECIDGSMFQLSELIHRHYSRNDFKSPILVDLHKLCFDLTEAQSASKQKIGRNFALTDLDDKRNKFQEGLSQIDSLLNCVKGLIKFQEYHRDSIVAMQANFYFQAVSNCVLAGEVLNSLDYGTPANVFVYIRREHEINLELIRDCVREVWFQVVAMKGPTKISSFEHAICVEVCFSIQFESYSIGEICNMLSDLNIYSVLFRQFSNLVLEFLIWPIFRIRTISLVIDNMGLIDRINFVYKMNYDNILIIPKFLTEIFQILSRIFADFDIGKDSLLQLGILIWPPIIEALKSQLLKLEIEVSETLKSDWMDFELNMLSFGIIRQDQKALSRLMSEIVTCFRDKRQANILSELRTLLSSDLSQTRNVWIQIDERKLSNQFTSDNSALQSNIHMSSNPLNPLELNYLDENLFIFPSCQVSIFTIEFVEKCKELMKEAAQSSTQHAFDIFKTIRYMFQMFTSFTPFYHNIHISSVPRNTAIFYNNCIYVAHSIITLGFEFRQEMPSPLNSEICTFIDFVSVVRHLGEETWLEMVNKQKCETLEFTSVLQSSISGLDGPKGVLVQKSFNSLISHLTQLCKGWRDVLPHHVVRGTLGLLLDSVYTTCINSVFQLSDISAKDASRASEIFSLLCNQSVDIFLVEFVERNEIMKVVCDEWSRFNELIILLDASLKLIQKRWGHGKGPFAQNFRVSEVRNFVKGSFKSSDKRTEILSSIF